MGVHLVQVLFPLLTVVLVAVAQRRFGHRAGGRLVGLPLTMTPFLAVLLVTEGPAVTASAAAGAMTGQVGVAVFCLAYARLAHAGLRPLPAVAGTLALVAATTVALTGVPPGWVAAVVAGVAVPAAVLALPAPQAPVPAPGPAPWWDVPARAAASAAVVVTSASTAHLLGPALAGLLATIPVVLTLITAPAHHRDGHRAAEALLHGALRSLPATTVFAATVAFGLPHLPVPVALPLAAVALVLGNRLPAPRLPHRATVRGDDVLLRVGDRGGARDRRHDR